MKSLHIAAILLFTFTVCKAQQNDMLPELRIFKNFYGAHAIDEKNKIPANINLVGIWKMTEDTDPHNYFVLQRYDQNSYTVTYMNRGGSNRTYENWGMSFSKVGNIDFMNMRYSDMQNNINGYFFLKVTELTDWTMTLSLVADNMLKDLPDSKTVRDQITKNSRKPGYYNKPVHFRKILPLMYCK